MDELARRHLCRCVQLFNANIKPYIVYDQLKAYKSLEGYNHFINGWVTNITVTEINVATTHGQ